MAWPVSGESIKGKSSLLSLKLLDRFRFEKNQHRLVELHRLAGAVNQAQLDKVLRLVLNQRRRYGHPLRDEVAQKVLSLYQEDDQHQSNH